MVWKLILLLIIIPFMYSCGFTSEPAGKDLVVCITFDDNYPSVYENAVPIMNQYGYRATMFVNSGLIGNPYYMSWEQLSELKDQYGWEIGGHTLNHDNLAQLTYEQAENVIKADFDSLTTHGFNPVSFATSFGICPSEYYPIISRFYRNLRTCFDNPMYNPIDRSFLGCFSVTVNLSPQDVENRISQAVIENENLVILLFHRVSPGLTNISNYEPDRFAEVMERLNNLDVKVLPLNEALNYLEK
jgi:peptidoglycan/xylan/chitin deacetylase (PgdA/CDA1 family)